MESPNCKKLLTQKKLTDVKEEHRNQNRVHCTVGTEVLKNVLNFFACMYRSIAVDEGYHIENNFWALKSVEKSLQSLGFEPMTLGLH